MPRRRTGPSAASRLSEKPQQIPRDSVEEDYPGHSQGLISGVYRREEAWGFRAGSYRGYDAWRRMLAQFALGKTSKQVWAEEAKGPFSELINFSGCQGYIGPVVAAKLAKDFADYQRRAEEYAAN